MKRLMPPDALRGFIMMVMALDHANLFIAHGQLMRDTLLILLRLFVENPQRACQLALYFGNAFLVVFIPLRALNGFGNIRPEVGSGLYLF